MLSVNAVCNNSTFLHLLPWLLALSVVGEHFEGFTFIQQLSECNKELRLQGLFTSISCAITIEKKNTKVNGKVFYKFKWIYRQKSFVYNFYFHSLVALVLFFLLVTEPPTSADIIIIFDKKNIFLSIFFHRNSLSFYEKRTRNCRQ